MAIKNYFSIGYLIKFGYFDFKPESESKRKHYIYLLENDKYVSYMESTTFSNKVFNCNDLFENLHSILKLDFNSRKETVPIEFSIYKTDDSRRIYKMPNIYSYLKISLHLNEYKDTYINILKSSKKSLSNTFYDKNYSDNERIREKNRFGMKYIFETDIQEFYPSLYTHTIPWILVGKEKAKENRNNKNKEGVKLYYNILDSLIQKCQYGETNGIPMGTFVSRLIAEIYMCKLDTKLEKHNYVRYVDDFELAYNLEEEQIMFFNDLKNELKALNMRLKIEKNKKISFPFKTRDSVKELNRFFNRKDLYKLEPKTQAREIHRFIDMYLDEYNNNGTKGALKLLFIIIISAIKSNKINKEAIYRSVKDRLLNLVLMKPSLSIYFIDLIYEVDDADFNKSIIRFINKNKDIFIKNINNYMKFDYNHEIYSILSIFYLLDIKILEEEIIYDIVDKMDDFNVILAIQLYSKLENVNWDKLFEKLEEKLKNSSNFGLDFWLLKYEIYYEVKKIKKSKFREKYRDYLYNKYGNGINRKYFFEPKNLKQLNSNIIFEVQLKNTDNSISKFYETLIENNISFLNRL